MDELKQSQDIINLGKKLIEEFSNEDQHNTTLCWMAYYLSELILTSENETDLVRKTQLQKETCELILGIWENRKYFPGSSRPLAGLSSAVEVINSLRTNDPNVNYWERTRNYEDSSPWGSFSETLRKSSQNIFSLTILASIGQDILLKEKEWTKFQGLLSEDEKMILEYIDEILQRDANPVQIMVTNLNKATEKKKPEKIEEIFDNIEKLLKEQLSKFEVLKSAVLAKKDI